MALFVDFWGFSPFLFVGIIKLFCTDMKIKQFIDHVAQILGNHQKSTNNFMSNSDKHIEFIVLSGRYQAVLSTWLKSIRLFHEIFTVVR